MHTDSTSRADHSRRYRPSRVTVFTTAFIAGAAVAFGVNRMLDVHLAQTRPQVECEPIFVALHSLPQGAPITVWDVALKDWPRAMLPTSALRARDTFEGMVLRHPLREGQPLLSVQLVPADGAARSAVVPAEQSFTNPLPAAPATQAAAAPEADLWAPAVLAKPEVAATSSPRPSRTDVDDAPPVTPHPTPVADAVDTFVAPQPAGEPTAAAVSDTARTESLAPFTETETVVEPVVPPPALEPTLAAAPEPAANPQPEPAQPELLAATAPLYAPVPASPPTDLDGQLAGVGGLPATGVPQDPNAAASVLKQTADDGPAAGPQPAQSAGRYLVVPERIAMQADAAFAPPPAAQATAASQRPQQSPAAKTATKPVNRPGTANGQRSGAKRSQQQSQQAGQGAGRQAAAATSRPLGGMFPNLTAGLEALSGSQRKPATPGQPSSTTR
ncbi:MAG: SAF domain-containing protein [Pirellulales bacterium]